jgi:NAD(P)-dependent dehydrogenase (short-subunit alcohol dehydrogenase family)
VSLLDALLDATVVRSFDRAGFARHARRFDASDLDVDLSGQAALVTGGNSGIGLATARGLAQLGADVWLLCRDRARGEAAAAEIGPRARVATVDVSDLRSVDAVVAQLPRQVHALVHNAGVLLDARVLSAQGFEQTVATHLIGPWALTRRLADRMGPGARLIWVASGGMYPVRLDPVALFDPPSPFDGVTAYAQCKRAQVALTPALADRYPSWSVQAMHPGWADTPAVASSLPRFHAWTRGILRTPAQGADTVVWLAAAAAPTRVHGGFWFDRAQVDPHPLPWTRSRPGDLDAVVARLDAMTA